MSQNIYDLLLESKGISKEASGLAKIIYDLQDTDSNIVSIRFPKKSSLIINIELRELFQSNKEFETYLTQNKIPFDNVLNEENTTKSYSFFKGLYTPDSVQGIFYQSPLPK
ncbi:MAG: hypothetical protein PF569_10230 [Candidatus Woesearchaeota archaeon]|jgi:hypothetical protein|nr:hypothetical protein [Candidatus Woesearchaeota archaeon]